MTARTADRAAARREQLVQAAYTVFSQRGYHACGVADIVKQAGVSHGTFYNYFDNKRHVLDAVFAFSAQRLVESVVGPDRPGAATTPEEFGTQFRAILRRLFDTIEREPKLVEFVMLDAPAIDTELVNRLLAQFLNFAEITEEYVTSGIDSGFLRGDIDKQIASEGLLALMLSVVFLALHGPVSAEDRDRHIDGLVDFAFAGVAA